MAITQSRRGFVAGLAFAGAAGLAGVGRQWTWWSRKIACRGTAAGGHHHPLRKRRCDLLGPASVSRNCCAPRALPISNMSTRPEAHLRRADAAKSDVVSDMITHGEVDFGRQFAPSLVMGIECRRTAHGLERPASRVLRDLREKGDPDAWRPQG